MSSWNKHLNLKGLQFLNLWLVESVNMLTNEGLVKGKVKEKFKLNPIQWHILKAKQS